MSGLLAEIRWSVCISKSQKILCVLFSRTESGLWIYNLLIWSNFNFLYNSRWIPFLTESCLLLYFFCANLLLFLYNSRWIPFLTQSCLLLYFFCANLLLFLYNSRWIPFLTQSCLLLYFFCANLLLFLYNSQWIPFLTQSCLLLYFFCANLLHSLMMWLLIPSLSLHNLHFLFCYVLSNLALIKLVLMALFCAVIRRDSVSLLRFLFHSHFQVFSCEIYHNHLYESLLKILVFQQKILGKILYALEKCDEKIREC